MPNRHLLHSNDLETICSSSKIFRAVFDFLKQKRIIADMLDLPLSEMKVSHHLIPFTFSGAISGFFSMFGPGNHISESRVGGECKLQGENTLREKPLRLGRIEKPENRHGIQQLVPFILILALTKINSRRDCTQTSIWRRRACIPRTRSRRGRSDLGSGSGSGSGSGFGLGSGSAPGSGYGSDFGSVPNTNL